MITGQQARELLDGTTPGPWEWDKQTGDIESPPYILAETFIDADANGPLIVSAPDLAETVAWLYGKEPTQSWPDGNESAYEFGRSANGDWHRVSVWQNGKAINITVTDTLDPDQAVEAARALLSAAEKARHE